MPGGGFHRFFRFATLVCCLYGTGMVVGANVPSQTAFLLDANAPSGPVPWNGAQVYEYGEGKVRASADQRKVFFGEMINLGFDQLPQGQDCIVRATFLSDQERILLIGANGIALDDCFKPEPGKVVEREWTVPGKYLNKGYLNLTVYAMAGPNAVLQKLEILTTDGKALKMITGKDIVRLSDEDIDRLVLPTPRITPRPDRVEGVEQAVLSLNGVWEFSPAEGKAFSPIQVPGEWKMQGFDVAPYAKAVYRKSFSVPQDWKGKRIRLRFDAVHSDCRVLLNGREAGGHRGGMVPFELDVTDLVSVGSNQLEVLVQSESVADSMSCISEYAAHRVGGILRKVTIFSIPETCVVDESFKTDVDPVAGRAAVHYQPCLENAGKQPCKVELTTLLRDPQGNIAGERTEHLELQAGESKSVNIRLDVDKAQLWTSETPSLYKLESRIKTNGKPAYSKVVKVGLREVEVKDNELFVNGKPVKLMGVNRHEVHPLSGRSLSGELCRKDAQMYKDANVNLVRTSHYPPSEEFLNACDELGLFVECESALCWVGQNGVWYGKFDVNDPLFFRYAHLPNMEQIVAYKSHPSIVIWSMANESNWNQWWGRVLNVNKKLDSSRPYTFHHQNMKGEKLRIWGVDIANQHYPSEHNSDEWSSHKEPLWFGEYAHLQCYNRRELMTDPSIHEDWSRPLQRMVDLMWKQKGCLGGAIWSGIDDIFILPDGSECGYGSWGPIDGWRREKPEYHGMRMAYTPMRLFSSSVNQEGKLVLNVQNRFNFKNLNQFSLRWECGGKSGEMKADIAPHAQGEIVVGQELPKGASVDIVLRDLQGKELARERVVVPGGPERKVNEQIVDNLVAGRIDPDGKNIVSPVIPELPLPVPLVQSVNGEGGTQLVGQKITPLTDLGDWTWTGHAVSGKTHCFEGTGDMGTGTLFLTPEDNGMVKVKYELTVPIDVNPRQWGVVFTLPDSFDTIEWDRNPHWAWYPDGHIGRACGEARANVTAPDRGSRPSGPPAALWKDDSNELGSNDFRGTKLDINYCRMKSPEGGSLVIVPVSGGPRQSVRAWKDKGKTRVLVSGFTTGGSDRFFWIHYQNEYKNIKKGDTISSEFMIGLKRKD